MAVINRKVSQPDSGTVKSVRLAAKLTQEEAAELVHLGANTRWSEYETGQTRMELARWELFLIKTNQHPDFSRCF